MDAITLLRRQHADVNALFKQFKKHHEVDERRAQLDEIADLLAAHCEIEEQLFYPAVFSGPLQPLIQEAVEEHLSAKRVIADLLHMAPDDSQFLAKVTVLEELVRHHVTEEHESLFPAVRARTSSTALRTLGDEMLAMFTSLMMGQPRDAVSGQIAMAASLPPVAPEARRATHSAR